MYDAMMAETISMTGHNGDTIEAYIARPLSAGPHPGVVVIHHAPGYDPGTKEIARTFAVNGYAAVIPNLYSRIARGPWAEVAATARAGGGVPDDQVMGDIQGAMKLLRGLSNANGKVGLIGYCSGGRQAFLAACRIPDLDAVVDCYGGGVIQQPDALTANRPVSPITLAKDIKAPILGLFGVEDANPPPAMIAEVDAELTRLGKTFEFHHYENAGHGFFTVGGQGYRSHAANDGWERIWQWYGKYLS